MDQREQIQATAVAMLHVAFAQLHEDNVLPASSYRPYLQVVRDYRGFVVKSKPEFRQFVDALVAAYPGRFGISEGEDISELAGMCAFNLLDACIARLTKGGTSYDVTSPTVQMSIHELIDMLDADDHEAACCRLVAHLTTSDGVPVDLGDLKIIPVGRPEDAIKRITEVIPAAPSAFNRNPPVHYDPPQAVVVGIGRDRNPGRAGFQKSKSIDRFLLLTRLLTAGTTHSVYEMTGQTQLVGLSHPRLTVFDYHDLSLLQRTTTLSSGDAESITGLGNMLDALNVERDDMVATSFQIALLKFTDSHRPSPWYDQLVDLSTALEAILSGQDKDDVTLRLRSRAAALLAGPDDPADAIFSDVGKLYGLRSTLVHGGSLKTTKALNTLGSISTAKPGHVPAVAVAVGVDRLRDLVRRAILARIGLASAEVSLWPVEGLAPQVDEILADDQQRLRWRTVWRSILESIGAGHAAERPSGECHLLSGDPI